MNPLMLWNSRHSRELLGRRRRESGQSTVELAAAAVILMVLAWGVIDLGRIVSSSLRIASVAREGARLFVAYEYVSTEPGLDTKVQQNVYTPMTQMLQPDNIATDGVVIISIIRRTANQLLIQKQFKYQGAHTKVSKVGVEGAVIAQLSPRLANEIMPVEALRTDEEMVLVEVFYKTKFITPITRISGMTGSGGGLAEVQWIYDRALF
jgi:Flp pilus assembly protein TadG